MGLARKDGSGEEEEMLSRGRLFLLFASMRMRMRTHMMAKHFSVCLAGNAGGGIVRERGLAAERGAACRLAGQVS